MSGVVSSHSEKVSSGVAYIGDSAIAISSACLVAAFTRATLSRYASPGRSGPASVGVSAAIAVAISSPIWVKYSSGLVSAAYAWGRWCCQCSLARVPYWFIRFPTCPSAQ